MIKKKVGSITLAAGLITVGVLLFVQNFTEIPVKDIYKYWPVLLIGLGLEMVSYMLLYGKGNTEVKLSIDALCIAFIIIMAIVTNGIRFADISFPGHISFGDDGISILEGVMYKAEIRENYKRDNISENFDLKELKITNNFGDIKLLPADSKSIRIEAEVTVKCNDEKKARAYANDAIEIKEGETTEISPKNPANWSANEYSKAQIDFVIYVPKQVQVYAGGSFGDIKAEDIEGKCKIENKNGEIKATNIKGDVEIDNSFGDITISNVEGKAEITDRNGEIKAEGIFGTAVIEGHFGDISISRVNGSAVIENRNGRIEAVDILGDVRIKNSFGDIHFKSESINNSDIFARTNFGSIDYEKPLRTNREGNSTIVQGKLGKGKNKIELITNNGDIVME